MGRYRLRPKAEKDLEDIWNYTVKRWGIEQAVKYIDELDEAFGILAGSPHICRERPEFDPPVHIHHHKKHLVIYMMEDSSIFILRVLHENMDIDAQLDDDLEDF